MMGELENWRRAAVWVRKMGVKVKWVVSGFVVGVGVGRRKALVVRVRSGVDGDAGRVMSVRRARRARGEIN
jgi:hypothetical protein